MAAVRERAQDRPDQAGRETVRRPDASMDLLRAVRENALDPAYERAAQRPGGRRRRWPLIVVVTLVAGLMIGTAIGSTLRSRPAAEQERQWIIDRIAATEASQEELRARLAGLTADIRDLQGSGSGVGAADQEALEQLGAAAGTSPVRGPGIVLTIDDGPDPRAQGSRILDTDLRHVVNGLWQSGAEAVAINGRRLSARTAIRAAGDAITVDFRSLTRPYVVEAVGDPDGLRTSFPATEGGRWLEGLRQHYAIVADVTTASDLRLPADPGLGVDRARLP